MLERPVAVRAGESVSLCALVDGSCLVVYVNDLVALSCRTVEHVGGSWGLFVAERQADVAGARARKLGDFCRNSVVRAWT